MSLWKKWKKLFEKSWILSLVHILWYMFHPKISYFSKYFLKIFFQISVKFQNSSGTTVTVTLAVTVKTFSLENVAKMKWHSPNIYRSHQKQFGQHFQWASFHGGPLLWGYPKSGTTRKALFWHIFSISAMKGPQMWPKSIMTCKYNG